MSWTNKSTHKEDTLVSDKDFMKWFRKVSRIIRPDASRQSRPSENTMRCPVGGLVTGNPDGTSTDPRARCPVPVDRRRCPTQWRNPSWARCLSTLKSPHLMDAIGLPTNERRDQRTNHPAILVRPRRGASRNAMRLIADGTETY